MCAGRRTPAVRDDAVSLRDYVEHIYAELQTEMDRRFGSQDEAAKASAHALATRLNSMNEFREALKDQTQTFVHRNELTVSIDAVTANITRNSDRLSELELRVYQRLDRLSVSDETEKSLSADRRLDTGTLVQVLMMIISVAAVIVVALHP